MSLANATAVIRKSPHFPSQPDLWNPVHYLWLLHDIFYFPQSVRDYVDGAPGTTPSSARNPFLVMWAVLASLTILAAVFAAGLTLALIPESQGLPWRSMIIGWLFGALLSGVLMFTGVSARSRGNAAVVSLGFGVALAGWATVVFMPLVDGIPLQPGSVSLLSLATAAGFGVALSLTFALAPSPLNSFRAYLLAGAIVALLIALSLIYVTAEMDLLTTFVIGALAAFGGALLGAVRLDDWLIARFAGFDARKPTTWNAMGHVTPLRFSRLSAELHYRLTENWDDALPAALDVWQYTVQQSAVLEAVHATLDGLRDDDLVRRVAAVADRDGGAPWGMMLYGDPWRKLLPAGRAKPPKANSLEESLRRERDRDRYVRAKLSPRVQELPTATQAQAVVAGFWYLSRGYYSQARDAFAKGPSSPMGKEMQAAATALHTLWADETLFSNPKGKLPGRPEKVAYPQFWNALDKLRDMLRIAHLHDCTPAPGKRHAAAVAATTLCRDVAMLPTAPGTPVLLRRLVDLAGGECRAELDRWLGRTPPGSRPSLSPVEPVANPYLAAALNDKRAFQGRKPELGELRSLWATGNLQPVVIYGLPSVGKTSLLNQAGLLYADKVQVARFQLSYDPGSAPSVAQVLTEVCAVVQGVTRPDLLIPGTHPPSPLPDFGGAADPFGLAKNFIVDACRWTQARNLVLALDDYDQLHTAIAKKPDLAGFLPLLRDLSLAVRNFEVVFVSIYPPALFPARTLGPFAGATHALFLKNLDRAEVGQLLDRPDLSLPVKFLPSAHDEVWRLSGGHPYLAQLLAYHVVQQFNGQAIQKQGVPLFDAGDVKEAARSPHFIEKAQPFFQQMDKWVAEAGTVVCEIVEVLAKQASGLSLVQLSDLLPQPRPRGNTLSDNLVGLQQAGLVGHDEQMDRYSLPIGLYCRWRRLRPGAPC